MKNKYRLKISGRNVKRFIDDLIKEKIYLYDISVIDDYCYIIVDDIGYKKIMKKKTIYNIKLTREYGFIKYKNLFKKYLILIITVIISFIFIRFLSNIVFDIKIENQDEDIRNILITDLDEYGIKKYHFKVSFKEREIIKKKILKKEKDKIEWLEIEEVGVKYIVKVQQRIKNKDKEKDIPQNIIAKKDCMILNIEAVHGEVVKEKYDYVKKGDIIISGIIMNKDKPMKKVKADGTIYGEVWYKVTTDIPKDYKKVIKTGKYKEKMKLVLLNKSIMLFNDYKSYDIHRKKIIYNNIIPIGINYTKLEETIVHNKKYTIETVDKSAIKIAESKLKNKLGKKDSIIDKKVLKKIEKNSRIVVEIFFKVKEDITDTESIEKIDMEKYKIGDGDESSN